MSNLKDETRVRLPKSAQEYIHDLEISKKLLERHLKELEDLDTPSPFYYSSIIGGGSTHIRYVQTHRMSFKNEKIEMHIVQGEKGTVKIFFNGDNGHDVYISPQSANLLEIVYVKRE